MENVSLRSIHLDQKSTAQSSIDSKTKKSLTYTDTKQPLMSLSVSTFPNAQSRGFFGLNSGHFLQRSLLTKQSETPDIFV